VTKYDLEKLDSAREDLKENKEGGELDPALAQELLDDLASEFGFSGVTALLRDLGKRVSFNRYESTVLTRDGKGLPVHVVEGEWNKETLKKIAPPKQSSDPNARDLQKLWEERKPEYVMFPRKCRIYLSRDGGWPWTDSLWPLRIEWWGQASVGAADEVLVAIDYALPSRQTPPDTLFQLAEDEKKLKHDEVDPRKLVESRRNSRLRTQASQDTGISVPTGPAKKP
jgi:hypothetical protein